MNLSAGFLRECKTLFDGYMCKCRHGIKSGTCGMKFGTCGMKLSFLGTKLRQQDRYGLGNQ